MLALLLALALLPEIGVGGASGALHDELVEITILNFSDYHGRLEPVPFQGQQVSGAAFLKAHFDRRAALAATEPFIITGGDEVGATPPLSSLFEDMPTIDVLNMMGLSVAGLGNHNFDHGVDRMRRQAQRAEYPYLAANLLPPEDPEEEEEEEEEPWWSPSVVAERGGVQIGFIAAINPEAPELTKPGSFGKLGVEPPAPAINEEAARLRAEGVRTIVAVVHIGETNPVTSGALSQLAAQLRGVDLLIGDHTNQQVVKRVRDADGKSVHVVENLSYGVTFSEIKLLVDPQTGAPVEIASLFFLTHTAGVAPDPEIQAYIDALRAELAPKLQEVVGASAVRIPQATRVAEANQGNLVADAMREAYGTDFAMKNTGALRADLTRDGDRDEEGLYRIRREYVLDVLPFDNVVVTMEIGGDELKSLLEHGVGAMPSANGRFPQVSGLQFDYRTSLPPGQRIVAVRRHPGGEPVDLAPAATYTIAMNDFMAAGGDGYPVFPGRGATRGAVDQIVEEYLERHGPVSPEGPIPPATQPATRIFRLD